MRGRIIVFLITLVMLSTGTAYVRVEAAGITAYGNNYGEQLSGKYSKDIYNMMIEQYVYSEDDADNVDGAMTGLARHIVDSGKFQVNVGEMNKEFVAPNEDKLDEMMDAWSDTIKQDVMKSGSEATDAFMKDYPQVYWMKGSKVSVKISMKISEYSDRCEGKVTMKITFQPTLFFAEATDYIDDFNAGVIAAEKKIRANCGDGASEVKKVEAIHDFIAETVSYNRMAESKGTSEYKFAHTPLPAFVDNAEWKNSFVCEGYSKTFKILTDRLGVQSVIFNGKCLDANGKSSDHIWNGVKVEGNWYVVDVAWDDQDTSLRKEYFLAGLDTVGFNGVTLEKSHTPSNVFSSGDYVNSFVIPAISRKGYYKDDNSSSKDDGKDVGNNTGKDDEKNTSDKGNTGTAGNGACTGNNSNKDTGTGNKNVVVKKKQFNLVVRYKDVVKYTGKKVKNTISVLCNGKCLKSGKDYVVKYQKNINVGKAKAIINFIGEYAEVNKYSVTFKIKKFDLGTIKFGKLKAQKYFKGMSIKPNVIIKHNGKKLIKGKDYTVSYKNNRKRGKAQIIIKGKGNYTGKKVIYFRIK